MLNRDSVAIIMLSCRDYEALEVSLACHLEFGDPKVKIFILQNCFGDYDAERTLQVARRYSKLYPRRLHLVEGFGEGVPYDNIGKLIASDLFSDFTHVIKVDDDAFPIRTNWVVDLINCWNKAESIHEDALAYVTPLINNNCWGFSALIHNIGLADEYYSEVARVHEVGSGDRLNPHRVLDREEIFTGSNGTIWASPHVARWLHEKTTLNPAFYVEATRELGMEYVDHNERYSIGALLFRKQFWDDVSGAANSRDDEHLVHMYCQQNQKRIVCQLSIPFVHFAYFSQRFENRDIIPRARSVYQEFTGVNYPIGLVSDRLLEIESRLRWMEKRGALVSFSGGGKSADGRVLRSKLKTMRRAIKSRLKLYRERLFKVFSY